MKGLFRITKIVKYVAQCCTAIADGFEAASKSWPTDSPFNRPTDNSLPNAKEEPKQ